MKSNKNLIIQLLLADLKHNQLIWGLRSIHFNSELYGLHLVDTIAELMGITGDITDQWFNIYTSYVDKAHAHTAQDRNEYLLPIAEECYTHLATYLKVAQLANQS